MGLERKLCQLMIKCFFFLKNLKKASQQAFLIFVKELPKNSKMENEKYEFLFYDFLTKLSQELLESFHESFLKSFHKNC